jgi:triosephosphate isomerase
MMRKPIIAGNWKMHKTIGEAVDFVNGIKDQVKDPTVDVVICAPALLLPALKEVTKGTNVNVAAQNMHWEEKGAFTGEISPIMLKDLGVEYCVLGHSERRQYFNETDETVNKKVLSALSHGILPIMCIGETLEQREEGKTNDVVNGQVIAGLETVSADHIEKVVLAYEPIWAIGTGKTATPEQANEVIAEIRNTVVKLYGQEKADKVRIQYGGSVKPANVSEIMSQSDIDGALVGGASLKTDDFVALVKY